MRIKLTTQDGATPRLRQINRLVADKPSLNRAMAEGALPVVQRHFVGLAGSNRNRFGVRSSFWNRMLSGTIATADAQAGYIRMPREVGLRFHGGTVTPKVAKNLAIPANAAAYGKSPRDFSDLRFVILGGAKALVKAKQQAVHYRKVKGQLRVSKGAVSGGRDAQGRYDVFYWLVPSATIAPNPDILPKDAEIIAAATASLNTYFARLNARNN